MTDVIISKADRKIANVAAHTARLVQLKAEGAMRRAAKKEAGLAKQAAYLQGKKDEAAAAKAERVKAHDERLAAAKKTAKAA